MRATETMLADGDRPTAIFAANDLMAIGAIQALRERSIAVPDDIAVVGFDDISAARLITPPLTTVAQFQRDMGAQGGPDPDGTATWVETRRRHGPGGALQPRRARLDLKTQQRIQGRRKMDRRTFIKTGLGLASIAAAQPARAGGGQEADFVLVRVGDTGQPEAPEGSARRSVQRGPSGLRAQHRLPRLGARQAAAGRHAFGQRARHRLHCRAELRRDDGAKPGNCWRSTTTPRSSAGTTGCCRCSSISARYNGKLYALAKTYETLGLFYNKTLFDKKGWTPPTTIAELEKLADTMKAEGLVPFAAGNADWRGPTSGTCRSRSTRSPDRSRLQGAHRRDAVDGRSDRQGDR